jgi:hypothetical protein
MMLSGEGVLLEAADEEDPSIVELSSLLERSRGPSPSMELGSSKETMGSMITCSSRSSKSMRSESLHAVSSEETRELNSTSTLVSLFSSLTVLSRRFES